ncbi:MAG: branched-chain amino acid ABC transporter permease [Chloroflexota bacterium]|nr:branched-chain amino acid ABC transporter permease [Chloroflexota bacterium]
MMRTSASVRIACYGIALLVALLLPHIIYPVLALDIVLWGLFAISVDLLLGFGGLLSFGHAAFWGSAAYIAGIVAKRVGVAFPIAVLIATIVAILLAIPIGYLSIRRQGIYFAMVTLAFAQMIYFVINQWRSVTGGENGLQAIPRTFPGVDLGNATTFYYFALPIALIGYLIAYRVVHSPFGHVLVAIRDNEARAQALGYPTHQYKLLGFVISAGLAGLAGSLFAISRGLADLDYARWTTSGLVVIMAILGGVGTLWGGVIGAVIVLLLRDWLSKRPDLLGVVTGLVFAVIVLGFRRGILGTILHRWEIRRPSTSDGPQSSDLAPTLPHAEPERGGTGGS